MSLSSYSISVMIEETRVLLENHRPSITHWQIYILRLYQVHLITDRNQTLYYKVVSSTPHHRQQSNLYYKVVSNTPHHRQQSNFTL